MPTATTAECSAVEAAQRIADVLGAASIPYAIGGALALAVAGVPRGTADVDINVFVDVVSRWDEIVKRFAPTGTKTPALSASFARCANIQFPKRSTFVCGVCLGVGRGTSPGLQPGVG